MKNFSITAIGEILYDVYPDKKRLGGAPFNYIYHVWKILGKANFISSVGDDENGNTLLEHLSSIGFDTGHIYIDKTHPTGTVSVKLGDDKIPRFAISPQCSYDFIKLNDASKFLIEERTDLLYFGTLSTRNGVSRETIQSLFFKPQLKYFCDLNLRHNFYTKELLENTLRTCNAIKINTDELNTLIKLFGLDQSHDPAIEQLFLKFDIDLIGLTMGADGSVLYNRSEKNFCNAGTAVPSDTLGAGDAYSAILSLGYLYGWELGRINRLGSEFAGEICKIDGALPRNDSLYSKYRDAFLSDL